MITIGTKMTVTGALSMNPERILDDNKTTMHKMNRLSWETPITNFSIISRDPVISIKCTKINKQIKKYISL